MPTTAENPSVHAASGASGASGAETQAHSESGSAQPELPAFTGEEPGAEHELEQAAQPERRRLNKKGDLAW